MVFFQLKQTIPEALDQRVETSPLDIAYVEKDESQSWKSTTWKEFSDKVSSFAMRLYSAGMRAGDHIAILMPNSLSWEIIQHSVYRVGGIVIGLDARDPSDRMKDIFSLCAPKYLFTDSIGRLTNLPAEGLVALEMIVCCSVDVKDPGIDVEKLEECSILSCDDLPPAQEGDMPPSPKGDHTATVIFTSGTTGRPKALSFRHDQFTRAMTTITSLFGDLPPQANTACWMPLANPFQRIVNLCAITANWKVYMVPDPSSIMASIREIEPHLFAAVPRFYEKLYQGIQQQIADMPQNRKRVALWAEQIGQKYRKVKAAGKSVPLCLKCGHSIANRLVLRKIRSMMGGNLRYLISGSAPAGTGLIAAYEGLGWNLLEAYGISENILPMAINAPDDSRPGSVGHPLDGNDICIAEDGEILVKGPGLALEVTDKLSKGYFGTGDLGFFDADGFLHIAGRKSDMFKLSTGRKIIPAAIEEAVSRIEAVEHCVAAGMHRKYVVILANVPEETWHQLIQQYKGPGGARKYLQAEIRRACGHLPDYSRPVDVAAVSEIFSPETGELTANMKIRRKFILEKYADTINALYNNGDRSVR